MAGKSDTSATLFAQKKLLGKAHTSNLKIDGEEVIGSNIQTSTSLIFGESIPTSPTQTLYLTQSVAGSPTATVEYIQFILTSITGTTYDANISGGGSGTDVNESSQVSGPHAYKFILPSDYQSLTSNPRSGNGTFNNNKLVLETLGQLQLIPPFYSQTSPNPYIVKIYKDDGAGGVGDEIPLLDNVDWTVDYYNGVLFLQDYSATKLPAFAKGFAYIGKMASEVIGSGSAGSGGGSGDSNATYFVLSATGSLASARTFLAGTGITTTDAGAGGSYTVSINNSTVATISGSTFTGVTKHNAGLSGSLTKLIDGSSYIVGGGNVSVSSASNGTITLATINSGTIHGVTAGTGLTGGGASGAVTLNINDSIVATISGSTFTGVTKHNAGLSGSLTRLTDGTSYLSAGSGVTISSASNGAITIASDAAPQYVFPSDISVSLTGGRTFGRYASGATIPATGKTPAEVILLAVAEPIDPTVSIAGTNPITSTFGISGSINSSITGSYIINTLGGSVSAVRLQFRSGSSGNYTILSTSTTSPLNFDHTFEVGAFFTTALNYQYIVTDNSAAYATGSLILTPQAYSAPSISLTVVTTTPDSVTGETNSKREKGNVGSTITGTITRNRTNAPLSSYSVQYQVNGSGAWVDVTGLSNISASGASVSIPSTSHNDVTLKTSTSLVYRVQVVDSYQTTTSSSTTISFLNVIFFAPVATAPTTSANVRAIANKVFTDSANPFNLITSTVENDFAVALPTTSASNDTISSVIDLDALNADITTNYVLSTFNVDDAGGTAVSYNVYTLSNATSYATSHRHQITRA